MAARIGWPRIGSCRYLGGIVPDDKALIPTEIYRQARVAFDNADLLVLVVDAQAGLTPLDQELGRMLRTTGKPFFVAVNKVDSRIQEVNAGVFHQLGAPLFPIAAEHGTGVDDLLDAALTEIQGNDVRTEPKSKRMTADRHHWSAERRQIHPVKSAGWRGAVHRFSDPGNDDGQCRHRC